MSRNAIIIVVLATLAASGCAHARTAASSVEPSAAVSDEMANLAGHWRGAVWEIGASLVNGQAPLDLQLGPDGTWRGTVGKAQASGTARFTQRSPDTVRHPAAAGWGSRAGQLLAGRRCDASLGREFGHVLRSRDARPGLAPESV
jgi:hypothetical protein